MIRTAVPYLAVPHLEGVGVREKREPKAPHLLPSHLIHARCDDYRHSGEVLREECAVTVRVELGTGENAVLERAKSPLFVGQKDALSPEVLPIKYPAHVTGQASQARSLRVSTKGEKYSRGICRPLAAAHPCRLAMLRVLGRAIVL